MTDTRLLPSFWVYDSVRGVGCQPDRADSLQRLSTFVARRQDRHRWRVRPLHTRIPERAATRRAKAFRHDQGRSAIRRRARQVWGPLHRPNREHVLARPVVVGHAHPLVRGALVVSRQAVRGITRLRGRAGAGRVRDLVKPPPQRAPAITFIDDLDALGRARGIAPYAGGHDEKEQTLNQLLVELDGFDSRSGLVILAATNRPEILDPALLRAGRFDRQVLVDRPDKKGRVQILQVHMKKVKVAADVDADKVAALTPGFTGADLANLVNEAALLATRRGADATSLADFGNAVERIA